MQTIELCVLVYPLFWEDVGGVPGVCKEIEEFGGRQEKDSERKGEQENEIEGEREKNMWGKDRQTVRQ